MAIKINLLFAGIYKKEALLGLDIGSSSVKLALFEGLSGSWRLSKIKQTDITEGRPLLIAMQEILAGIAVKGTRVITLVNSPQAMVKRVLVPLMPDDELKEAISLEAGNYFPFSVEDSLIDFEAMGDELEAGLRKRELLVAACPNKAISEHLRLLSGLGIRPYKVIHPAQALCNILKLKESGSRMSVAALAIGKNYCELIIIREGKLAFNRKVPVCADDFTRSMLSVLSSQAGKIQLSYEEAEAMKIRYGIPRENTQELIENKITAGQLLSLLRAPAEKLSSEIERSFDFYREESRGNRVEKLVLLGGGGQLKGLDLFLSGELGISVEVYKSLEGVSAKEGTLPAGFEAGRVAMAVGAALDKKEGINFLPWEIKRDTQRLIEKAALKALVSAAITLLALIFIGMRIQLVNLDKKISGASSELASLKMRFGSAQDWPLMNRLIASEPRWGDILKEISNVIPAQAYLEEINMQAGQITVRGNIISLKNSEEILSGFIRKLEGGIFKNVRFVSLQEAATGREFELQAEAE